MGAPNFNRIKEFLVKQDRTIEELAVYTGRTPQAVSTWCRNIRQPDIKTLFRAADFFDVEAGELLTAKKDLRERTKKKKRL